MKKKIASIILSAIMIIGIVACHTSIPEDWQDWEEDDLKQKEVIDIGEASETPIIGETSKISETSDFSAPELINSKAEELYALIVNNRDLWEREYMFGGTLLDLDFDNSPEFIVLDGYIEKGYYDEYVYGNGNELLEIIEGGGDYYEKLIRETISVYKFDEEGEAVLFCELPCNWRAGRATYNTSIFLYTNEDGNKSWALPYTVGEAQRDGKSYFDWYFDQYTKDISEQIPWEYRFSLFDFTGGEPTEYFKFVERFTDSIDRLQRIEFFIDGEKLIPTDEEMRQYNEEYETFLENMAFLEEDPEAYYDAQGLWFDPFEPATPPARRFYDKKEAFEQELTAYKLDPNKYYYWDDRASVAKIGEYWTLTPLEKETDGERPNWLEISLIQLVNAYLTNDENYLIDYMAFNLPEAFKPVIYLYPEEETDVSVRVNFPDGRFTCTYPDYGNGWEVTASPNGTLINKADEQEYSYLYWEAELNATWDFSKGFVVKGSDTAKFLQEKLAFLGLTPREYNEFIVYWLPLMQDNEYNLIAFQTTAYTENAPLYVSPKPDSMLRVFMAYKPLSEWAEVEEQTLERFERTGFAVIEWGGTTVDD